LPLVSGDIAPYGVALAICASLTVAALLMGYYAISFSADSGVKLLASLSLLHHWTDASIPYRFRRLDPAGTYVLPLTAWLHGHDFSGYSLVFEYLTAFSLLLLGGAGTVLPAVLGTLAILASEIEIARMLELDRSKNAVLLLTVLATPVVFYSLTLWEHTWGVGLFLAGLALLLRASRQQRWSFAVGAAAGGALCLAVLMRREMIIPSVLLLILLPLVFRSPPAVSASAAAALVLLVPLFAIVKLGPQPLALSLTHASPGRAGILTGGSGSAAPSHIARLRWLTSGSFATGLLVAVTGVLLLLRLRRPNLLPVAMAAGAVVVGLAYVVQLSLHYTWTNENPLAFCPLLLLGLWLPVLLDRRDPRLREQTLLWLMSCLGALAVVWVAADYGGGQWGPRYLLYVFPLLIPLALKARQVMLLLASGGRQTRMINYSLILLVTCSVGLQSIGIMAIVTGKREWAQTAAVIATRPGQVVLSTGDPSIDSIASIYNRKTLLWASTVPELRSLMATLRRHALGRVTFVCGPRVSCHWNAFPGWRHGRIRRSNFVRYATYRANGV
jgi:hypothetical protein